MKSRFTAFWKDIGTSILATVYAVWLLQGCSTMKKYTNNSLAPSQIPSILAYLLLALAVIIAARAFINRAKEKKLSDGITEKKSVVKDKLSKRDIFNEFIPYLTFLLIGLYLYGIKTIGFSVATFLYLSLQINILERHHSKKSVISNILISLIVTVAVYLFFNVLLKMHLPVHAWFGKFRI